MDAILPAEPADAEAILELQRLAYQTEAELYDDWSLPPLTQTLEQLREEFAQKTFLKTCREGRLVGSVRAACQEGTCAIGRLVVHPGCRRQGLGTRLMQEIEAAFPAAERYELFTGTRSEGNLRLYESLGYRPFRTEKLSARVELVFMEKRRG